MRTSTMEGHYCIRKAAVEHSLLEVWRDMSGLLSREDGWLEVARQSAVQSWKSASIIRNGYDFLLSEMYSVAAMKHVLDGRAQTVVCLIYEVISCCRHSTSSSRCGRLSRPTRPDDVLQDSCFPPEGMTGRVSISFPFQSDPLVVNLVAKPWVSLSQPQHCAGFLARLSPSRHPRRLHTQAVEVSL